MRYIDFPEAPSSGSPNSSLPNQPECASCGTPASHQPEQGRISRMVNDDIILAIVEATLAPRAESAFVYEPESLRDLLSLICVSWRLHRLARPYLYRRVHLTRRRQVTLIMERNPPSRLPIRALALEGTALDHHDIWHFMFALGPTLERLLTIDPSYGYHFLGRCVYKFPDFETQFPRLYEVGNTYRYPFLLNISGDDPPVPVPVPELPYLRRQATLRLGHHFFSDCWAALESIATVSYTTADIRQYPLLIDRHPKLRELILVVHPAQQTASQSDANIAVKQAFAERYRDRVALYDVNPGLIRASMIEAWFAEALRRGTLWRMERKNWLSYGSFEDTQLGIS
ncbi:hypothetical protein CALCODRAFT_511328 [Calocera cornea HHB12733]|uniref:Uncharacterized protein n=1 Tax=Calocera cornea HHB12733 TaxID=1353952 RepID=A0A165DTX7_9BASI|nr:hypothetical protein CALCODRAFT_511328 [Calocera cornea HHB12733]